MTTAPDTIPSPSPALWHREGNLLYTLQHAGWYRGREEFKNHLTVWVEVHQGTVAEADALADRLHRFLSAAEDRTEAESLRSRVAELEGLVRDAVEALAPLADALTVFPAYLDDGDDEEREIYCERRDLKRAAAIRERAAQALTDYQAFKGETSRG